MYAEAAEYGQPERLLFEQSTDAHYVLGLGGPPSDGGLFVDASGWTVATNVRLPRCDSTTAVADTFAVAAGFAKLFATVIGRPARVLDEEWSFSLRRLSDSSDVEAGPEHLDLGELAEIGAGAIGSAVAHVLRHSGWRAQLSIFDDERYDEPNHETTLLISREDALRQRVKAETLAARTQREGLRVKGFKSRVDGSHTIVRANLTSLLVGVDNPETRRALDDANAETVLNAGVGGSRVDAGHLLYSAHGRSGLRLSELYPARALGSEPVADAPAEVAIDECSRIAYGQVAAAAPFMALGAGALLVAGVARHVLGDDPVASYIKFNLLGLLQRHQSQRR